MSIPVWCWTLVWKLRNIGPVRAWRYRRYAGDHRAIEAMIGDYRGQRFREIPPDPRRLDPVRLRGLSERLSNPYAYRWRETQADADLVDALFHTIAPSTKTRWGLCIDTLALDDDGQSPPIVVGPRGHARIFAWGRFERHHYVTACTMSVRPFITSYDEAVRLLDKVLPGYGFALRRADRSTLVRLEKGETTGPWITGSHAALALVLAILDHLERAPHEAAPWRTI
ncbi:hypothetical protein ACQVP2_20120 [Methylobacterium aquaticum]|uniref:hypothetical protein n=1 Tax=Methylobacterium aquaticum TaxID=270351 RepID=UPI003D17D6CC